MTTLTPDHLDAGSGDGPISPELVLIDPELARQLRARAAAAELGSQPELDGEPRPTQAVAGPDQYQRWGDELRLFQESALEEGLVWKHDEAATREPIRRPALHRPHEAPIPRRRRKRVLRLAGLMVAAIVLGGAGAALGDLFASSPEAPSTNGAARSAPSSPQTTPADDSTANAGTSVEGDAPRVMAWAPAAGVAAYEVALYKGSRRIFFKRTKDTRLALPAEWSYGGRRVRLESGVYRWYVWPVRTGARKASARPIVQASLTIPAS